jgi:Bifunctional DNA primase/polymerase, N-terminal
LPDTAIAQSGGGEGHFHYLYLRPKETPLININKPDEHDIQPRGYVVGVGSLHQSGRYYQWFSDYQWKDVEDLPFAPGWALAEIQEKWEAHSATPELDVDLEATRLRPGMIEGAIEEWWNGEASATHDDGTTDRSRTLFIIGKLLAKQGATPEEIVSSLRDRDESLGFYKYSRRKDGGRKAYSAIAQRVTVQREETTPPDEEEEDVPNKATGVREYCSFIRDIRAERSELWKEAQGLFPMPQGIRPYKKGALFRNRKTGKENWGDFYGRTWRNAANAQHHKQSLYFNILPKINGPQMYIRYVAPDDWNHETIVKAINRAKPKAEGEEHGWLGFNNALVRGHYVYLTSIPGAPGFVAVEGDIKPILVDALKALHPPERGKRAATGATGGQITGRSGRKPLTTMIRTYVTCWRFPINPWIKIKWKLNATLVAFRAMKSRATGGGRWRMAWKRAWGMKTRFAWLFTWGGDPLNRVGRCWQPQITVSVRLRARILPPSLMPSCLRMGMMKSLRGFYDS